MATLKRTGDHAAGAGLAVNDQSDARIGLIEAILFNYRYSIVIEIWSSSTIVTAGERRDVERSTYSLYAYREFLIALPA
jgi:hypothetical protein